MSASRVNNFAYEQSAVGEGEGGPGARTSHLHGPLMPGWQKSPASLMGDA